MQQSAKNYYLDRKILVNIEDKDIYFQCNKRYHGLLLLENPGIIKCSYFAMDDKENPYIIKVLTFDHKAEAADFMNRVEQIKKLNTSYLPTIEECVLDPNTYQVTIVEHFVSGISLKKIYEEMLTKKHLILKAREKLFLHRIIVQLIETLQFLEQKEFSHSYISLASVTLQPSQTNFDEENKDQIFDEVIDNFKLMLSDAELSAFLNVVYQNKMAEKKLKNSSIRQSLIEAPELTRESTTSDTYYLGKDTNKFDVWSVGVVILKFCALFCGRELDELMQSYGRLPNLNYQNRCMFVEKISFDPLLTNFLCLVLSDLLERPSPSQIAMLPIFNDMKELSRIVTHNLSYLDFHSVELKTAVGISSGMTANSKNLGTICSLLLINRLEKTKEYNLILDNEILTSQMLKHINTLCSRKDTHILNGLFERMFATFSEMIQIDELRVKSHLTLSGITAVIISLLEAEKFLANLLSFMGNFKSRTTQTLVHFVEKSGIVKRIIDNLAEEKSTIGDTEKELLFLRSIGHFTKISEFLARINEIPKEVLFELFLKMPMTQRNDDISKKVLNRFIVYLTEEIIGGRLTNEEKQEFSKVLHSWVFHRGFATFTSVRGICFNSFRRNERMSSELWMLCQTCSETINREVIICLNCSRNSHEGHNLISIGYDYLICDSAKSQNFNSQETEMPEYIYKQATRYLDIMKMTFNDIPQGFKQMGNKNFFLNKDGNLASLLTSSPLCTIESYDETPKEHITVGYFETEIKLGGFYDQIAIGVTTNKYFLKTEFAGYLPNSIAYHGDDGKCFLNGKAMQYGVRFGSHDIIGCGVTNRGGVFFTINGQVLPLCDAGFFGDIYPIVSLRGKYSSVLVNFEDCFLNLSSFKDAKVTQQDHSDLIPNYLIDLILGNPERFFQLKHIYEKERWAWLGKVVDKIEKEKGNLLSSIKEDRNGMRNTQNMSMKLIEHSNESLRIDQKNLTLGGRREINMTDNIEISNKASFSERVNTDPNQNMINQSFTRGNTNQPISEKMLEMKIRDFNNMNNINLPNSQKKPIGNEQRVSGGKASCGCGGKPSKKCNIF